MPAPGTLAAANLDPPQEGLGGIETIGHAVAVAGMIIGQPGEDGSPVALASSLLEFLVVTVESHFAMLLFH